MEPLKNFVCPLETDNTQQINYKRSSITHEVMNKIDIFIVADGRNIVFTLSEATQHPVLEWRNSDGQFFLYIYHSIFLFSLPLCF